LGSESGGDSTGLEVFDLNEFVDVVFDGFGYTSAAAD